MSSNNKIVAQGNIRTLKIDGKFDFEQHRRFRELYESAPPEITHFVIDLSRTDYMDSSALGMLLLLLEYVGGDRERVRIANCNPDIRKIFDIANFDKLFDIS